MIVNEAQIDWLTLTTTRETVAEYMYNMAFIGQKQTEQKRMQYEGSIFSGYGGTWFLGEGVQKGEPSYMLQVSGGAAEFAFEFFKPEIIDGSVHCSRIDVQLTIEYPHKWSQGDLIVECEAWGLKPEVRRSEGEYGELVTVYLGKRSSGRMSRTYVKETRGGGMFLRHEIEFGRNYAKAVAMQIARGGATRQEFINGEVYRRKQVTQLGIFSVGEGKFLPRVYEVKTMGKTEKWILNTVLPALVKYKNSHEHDDMLIQKIITELSRSAENE